MPSACPFVRHHGLIPALSLVLFAFLFCGLVAAQVKVPNHLRVDISVGTTGQLFVSWDNVYGLTNYNLERSLNQSTGFVSVGACSGINANLHTMTSGISRVCRESGLAVGTRYYYRVQACNAQECSDFSAPVSNLPVYSDCTPAQMPDMGAVKLVPNMSVVSGLVDPNIQFLPDNKQYAGYAAPSVARRNRLVVLLPGSGGSCSGIGPIAETAEKLGFDAMCVNYSNAAAQDTMCLGDPECFGNVSEAKFDATGPCSIPNGAHCGIDPATRQPFVNSNPADAVTGRIVSMLRFLSASGYDKNGTTWAQYLIDGAPRWDHIIIGGHSQGGDLATFAGYKTRVARVFNQSAPPQATLVKGVMTAATYLSAPKATSLRNFFGFVSRNELLYRNGTFAAVWGGMGFNAANHDAEIPLNTSTPIGLSCNTTLPSHNFSTSAPLSPGGGHNDTLYLWNEDVFKYMLID